MKMKQYVKKIIGMSKEKSALEVAVKEAYSVLMVGETGTGKTHLVHNTARRHKVELIRCNLNGEIGINELVGKWLIKDGNTEWQDGILTTAMRKGSWIVFDEINAALPEVLFCINSLLDGERAIVLVEKDNERVEAHKNFRFFAAMNPSDEYAGTKELNKSLLSRFNIVIEFNRPTAAVERDIVVLHTEIDEKHAAVMVDAANAIRKLKDNREIYYTMSTRDLISWGNFFGANNHSLTETFEMAILNKAHPEERGRIAQVVRDNSNSRISWHEPRSQAESRLSKMFGEGVDEIKAELAKVTAERDKANNRIAEMQTVLKQIAAIGGTK